MVSTQVLGAAAPSQCVATILWDMRMNAATKTLKATISRTTWVVVPNCGDALPELLSTATLKSKTNVAWTRTVRNDKADVRMFSDDRGSFSNTQVRKGLQGVLWVPTDDGVGTTSNHSSFLDPPSSAK